MRGCPVQAPKRASSSDRRSPAVTSPATTIVVDRGAKALRHADSTSPCVSFSTSADGTPQAVPVGVRPPEDRGGDGVLLHGPRAALLLLEGGQPALAQPIELGVGERRPEDDVREDVERRPEPRGERLDAGPAGVPVAPGAVLDAERLELVGDLERGRACPPPARASLPMNADGPGPRAGQVSRTQRRARRARSRSADRAARRRARGRRSLIVQDSMCGGVQATAGPGCGGLRGTERRASRRGARRRWRRCGARPRREEARAAAAAAEAESRTAARERTSSARTARRRTTRPHGVLLGEATRERRALDRSHDGDDALSGGSQVRAASARLCVVACS